MSLTMEHGKFIEDESKRPAFALAECGCGDPQCVMVRFAVINPVILTGPDGQTQYVVGFPTEHILDLIRSLYSLYQRSKRVN